MFINVELKFDEQIMNERVLENIYYGRTLCFNLSRGRGKYFTSLIFFLARRRAAISQVMMNRLHN